MLHRNKIKIALLIVATIISAQCIAEPPASSTPAAATVTQSYKIPYIAEVTGTDVYVRSGPGTAYYHCGKVSAPQKVIVTGHKYTWSKIRPIPGSFSWISTKYVKADPANPNIGIVTANNVRVYAGAPGIAPEYSTSQQTLLNQGDQVTLLGQEKNGYYKITPPVGAHLWIKSTYLKYVGPYTAKPFDPAKPTPKTPSKPAAPSKGAPPEKQPAAPEKKAPVPKQIKPTQPTPLDQQALRIKQCREISILIENELKKPADKQNYAKIKKMLKEIIADKNAGRAAKYAEYQLDMVNRFELAITVGKVLKKQDDWLEKERKKIQQQFSQQIKEIAQAEKFTVIGKIRPSYIYNAQTGQVRYLILNKEGKIICYAIPAETFTKDIKQYFDKNVGLIGRALVDKTSSITIVKFTDIVPLDAKDTKTDSADKTKDTPKKNAEQTKP